MGKTLIIAEKPSVMTDLAKVLTKVLGKFEKQGGGRDIFYESDSAVITSAVGHLVELRMPMGPNGKKLPWNFSVLPAIPDHFELDPIPDSEARLKQVLKLAKRKDVDSIVNACDAGREGELIFRYIMEIGQIDKPVKRLWMQSMTTNSILEAWGQLRPGEQMKPLADAAKCRSESDWLVGLNATRALTCFNSRHGGFNITAAGRVQTPTLAILAQREARSPDRSAFGTSSLRRRSRRVAKAKPARFPRKKKPTLKSPPSSTTSPRSSARPRFPPKEPSRSPKRFMKSTR